MKTQFILMFALSIFLFPNLKAQGVINPEQYGQYHNLGLELFFKENPNYNFSNFSQLMIDLSTTFHKKYPNIFTEEVDYSIANEAFKKENLTFKEIMTMSSVNLSPKFKELVLSLTDKLPNITETNSIIDNFIKNNSLTAKEKEDLLNFKSVCNYSNSFWSKKYPSNSSNSTNKWKCTAQAQQYLADGFGALFFGGLGAVGYSWAVHEFQQHNGGGCL